MWQQRSAQTTKPNIRPIQSVHLSYKMCRSNLQKACIRPKEVCACDLQICVQREQRDPYGIGSTTAVVSPKYRKTEVL